MFAIVNSHVLNLAPGSYRSRALKDPHEHFLGQILGLLAIADEVLQHRQQAVLIAQHQLRKGRGVAGLDLEHQPHVGVVQLVVDGLGLGEGQSFGSAC